MVLYRACQFSCNDLQRLTIPCLAKCSNSRQSCEILQQSCETLSRKIFQAHEVSAAATAHLENIIGDHFGTPDQMLGQQFSFCTTVGDRVVLSECLVVSDEIYDSLKTFVRSFIRIGFE